MQHQDQHCSERLRRVAGSVGALYLALIAWAPIAAFRKPTGILVFALLTVLATEVLRRQTAREFPDVRTPTPVSEPQTGAAAWRT